MVRADNLRHVSNLNEKIPGTDEIRLEKSSILNFNENVGPIQHTIDSDLFNSKKVGHAKMDVESPFSLEEN